MRRFKEVESGKRWVAGTLVILLAMSLSGSLSAETVFLPSAQQSGNFVQDRFASESYFGRQPIPNPDPALDREEPHPSALISDSERSNRAPAGMAFKGDSAMPPNGAPKPPMEMSARTTDETPDDMPRPAPRRAATPVGVAPTADLNRMSLLRKGVQEVALIAGDLGFFPKTFFVNQNIPVRLFVTGASKTTLCIMMDSFQVRKQVRTSRIEEITFTPNMPGTYRYYCPVNGMEGTMVVREIASNLNQQP